MIIMIFYKEYMFQCNFWMFKKNNECDCLQDVCSSKLGDWEWWKAQAKKDSAYQQSIKRK